MKPITYLCFTLLSIVIQFCLMDFINERIRDDTVVDLTQNSMVSKNLSHIFRSIQQKPHALYYRTERNNFLVKNKPPVKYNNASLTETSLTSSTALAYTVFDLLYDENVSVTDSDSVTESLFTSSDSEIDNATEITFFDKIPTTIKPTLIPKKISTTKCYCNLLYKTCDINCCCDNDCTELEKSMFKDCEDTEKESCDIRNKDYLYTCSSQFACNKELQSDVFGYLFCIRKVNLPKKFRASKNTLYALDVDHRLKWHVVKKRKENIKFTKNLYTIGHPIWMITNGIIESLDIPITISNEYCNGYKAVKFLKNENIKCYVKLKDLHMLDVLRKLETTKITSPKQSALNSTITDCTTLHCIDWTFLVCDEHKCNKYNNELHEPTCSESFCINIGFKVEYEFYCNVSLIENVIVKFHVRTMSMALEYVSQEITVNFYIGNNSVENIVKFSGNPGYIRGLPVIVSLSESNRTDFFYNHSVGQINYFKLPCNKDGACSLTNLNHKTVKFGHNKRIKCRAYFGQNVTIHNGTDACLKIQTKIDKLYGISPNIYVSPYGNPQDVSDENWVRLQTFDTRNIYGDHHHKDSKLLCYNLITRVAFIITFADSDANKEENKIINARIETTSKNITFSMEDLSTVITIDTIFIDANKPTVHDYIGAFNFHFPKDFFLPLATGKGSFMHFQNILVLCLCGVITHTV